MAYSSVILNTPKIVKSSIMLVSLGTVQTYIKDKDVQEVFDELSKLIPNHGYKLVEDQVTLLKPIWLFINKPYEYSRFTLYKTLNNDAEHQIMNISLVDNADKMDEFKYAALFQSVSKSSVIAYMYGFMNAYNSKLTV